jgi:hypothetical protein
VRGERRWRSNWRIVGPAGATQIQLPASRRARRASEQRLRELPAGTSVVLVATARRAGSRCRAVAGRAGIAVERTYLAFPSAEAPAYLVEDEPASVRLFLKSILVVPPRSKLPLPMLAAVHILRSLGTRRTMRTLAPGRVIVGRRV